MPNPADYTPLTHCPECDKPLDAIDPEGHALRHWPAALTPRRDSELAMERQAALLAEAKFRREHPEHNPAMGARGGEPAAFGETAGSGGAGT